MNLWLVFSFCLMEFRCLIIFFECPLNISHPDERRDDWWEGGSFVFPELEDTWLRLEARSALADASVVSNAGLRVAAQTC
jgi:hypothetical protein